MCHKEVRYLNLFAPIWRIWVELDDKDKKASPILNSIEKHILEIRNSSIKLAVKLILLFNLNLNRIIIIVYECLFSINNYRPD